MLKKMVLCLNNSKKSGILEAFSVGMDKKKGRVEKRHGLYISL